jgi:hypothetical protein
MKQGEIVKREEKDDFHYSIYYRTFRPTHDHDDYHWLKITIPKVMIEGKRDWIELELDGYNCELVKGRPRNWMDLTEEWLDDFNENFILQYAEKIRRRRRKK